LKITNDGETGTAAGANSNTGKEVMEEGKMPYSPSQAVEAMDWSAN
jgi:hypothetical protein